MRVPHPAVQKRPVIMCPVECAEFGTHGAVEATRVAAFVRPADLPQRSTRKEFPVALREESTNRRSVHDRPVTLASSEPLCEEAVESVTEGHAVVAVHSWNEPAVDFTGGILDFVSGFSAKLKHKKSFPIKAKYLRALVFVGISILVVRTGTAPGAFSVCLTLVAP